jgi:crossover junction endodeoxyribonuclease RuvC
VRTVAGIDPGVTGSIALYDIERKALLCFLDIPVDTIKVGRTEKKRVNIAGLVDVCREVAVFYPELVVIEDVGGLPGQSAPAAFSFGFTTGALHAAIAAQKLPIHAVPPARWKRALNVPASKDGARHIASRLFPAAASQLSRVKDDGKAEALLMALYGARHVIGAR